ncbi:hypothetical protein V6Z12_A04G129900 [Gossypium hirsutum]
MKQTDGSRKPMLEASLIISLPTSPFSSISPSIQSESLHPLYSISLFYRPSDATSTSYKHRWSLEWIWILLLILITGKSPLPQYSTRFLFLLDNHPLQPIALLQITRYTYKCSFIHLSPLSQGFLITKSASRSSFLVTIPEHNSLCCRL